MANTATGTVSFKKADLPAGYNVPVVSAVTGGARENFYCEIGQSGVAHASVSATGLIALVAAVKAWIEGTYLPSLGVDGATAKFVLQRVVPGKDSYTAPADQYLTGTDIYRVWGWVEWTYLA